MKRNKITRTALEAVSMAYGTYATDIRLNGVCAPITIYCKSVKLASKVFVLISKSYLDPETFALRQIGPSLIFDFSKSTLTREQAIIRSAYLNAVVNCQASFRVLTADVSAQALGDVGFTPVLINDCEWSVTFGYTPMHQSGVNRKRLKLLLQVFESISECQGVIYGCKKIDEADKSWLFDNYSIDSDADTNVLTWNSSVTGNLNLTMNHVLIIIEYLRSVLEYSSYASISKDLVSVLDIKQLGFTSIIDAGDKYFFSHTQDMYYFNELESCPCSL